MKTIKAKLILCIAAFVLVSTAMVISTLITVSKQESDTHVINAAGKQRMLSQKIVKEFYAYYSDSGEDEEALKVKENTLKGTINLFDETLTDLIEGDQELGLPAPETEEIEAQLLVVKELWSKFMATFNQGFAEGFYEEEEAFLNNNNLALLEESSSAVVLIAKASNDKVIMLERMQYIFLVISVLVGAVFFFLARVFILAKLDSMVAEVSKITLARDLTARLEESPDEIGELAKGFNFFLEEFQALLHNVAQATSSVHNTSAELVEASRKMESDALQQQQQTDQVATAVEEMNSTVLKVVHNSSSASDFVTEASQVAMEGGDIVRQTIDGINRIATSVDDSTQIISTLGENSNKIGQIISVIEGIAEQTNLLALNAAIEAARAGEQGRGFAVVADEVRSLAKRTSDATSEIAGMIHAIQGDTKSAVTAMANGTSQVEDGVDLANKAGASLERIVEVVGNVTDMVRQIANAAEEQSAFAGEINQNITTVAEISRKTTRISQKSASDNKALTEQVSELEQQVSQFRL